MSETTALWDSQLGWAGNTREGQGTLSLGLWSLALPSAHTVLAGSHCAKSLLPREPETCRVFTMWKHARYSWAASHEPCSWLSPLRATKYELSNTIDWVASKHQKHMSVSSGG